MERHTCMTVVETAPFRQERWYADRTGPDERSVRIDWTRSLILESESRTPDRCPDCEGRHIVKYGHTARGTERYRCKGCGRTFTEQGVVSRSRLSEDQWMAFAECYVDGDSIERTARACGVSKSTVRRMRGSLDDLRFEALGIDSGRNDAVPCFRSPGMMLKALRECRRARFASPAMLRKA